MEYTTNYNSGVIFRAEGWAFWCFSASTFWLMRLSPRKRCPRWSLWSSWLSNVPIFSGTWKDEARILLVNSCWSYSGLELRAILSLLRALRPGLCWQALHHLKVECLVIQLCSQHVSIHLPTVTRMEITTTSRDKNGVWRFKPMIYRFRVVVSRFSTGRKLSDLNLPGCSESCFSS